MRPVRPLTLVDCSRLASSDGAPSPDGDIEEGVWGSIKRAFSRPVNRADDTADYAPTQLIAEVFKDMGFDGLAYRSAFGEDGFNVAIFNPDHLQVRDRFFRVRDISHVIELV